MATESINYSAVQSITATLAGLADGAWRGSASVDNATNKFVDALVGGKVQVGAVPADGSIEIYAYGSYDGTEFTAGVSGTDGTITWGTSGTTGADGMADLPLLGVIYIDTADDNKDKTFGPFSVAAAFGGVLPPKWGVIVRNRTGIAFHATGASNEVQFTGIKYDVA